MARFEVFIPASEPDGMNMTLRVTADTWMAALKVGLKKIGEAQGMPKDVLCDIQDDESIHVTDPRTNRVFRILQIPDVSNPGLAPAAAPKGPWMSAPADPHPAAPAAAATEQTTVPEIPAPTQAELEAALAAQKTADKLAAQRAEAARKAHERAQADKAAAEAAAAERAAAEAQAAAEKAAAAKAAAEKAAAAKAAKERAAKEVRLTEELAVAERVAAKAKAERDASDQATAAQKAADQVAAGKAAEKTAKARAAAERAAVEAQAAAEQAEADQAAHEQAAADKVNAERVAQMARAAVASQTEKSLPPARKPASGSHKAKQHPITIKVVDKPKVPPPAQIGRLQPSVADTQQVEETLSELFERTPALFEKPMADALYYLLDLAMEKVPVDSGTVYVADVNRRDLGFAAVRGPKAKELLALKLRVPMGKGFVGFCAQEGVAVAISDVQRDKRFFREISDRIGYDTRSMITTPIILHGRTLGAIQLINKKGSSSFSQAELSILHYLAHQGALLLEAAE